MPSCQCHRDIKSILTQIHVAKVSSPCVHRVDAHNSPVPNTQTHKGWVPRVRVRVHGHSTASRFPFIQYLAGIRCMRTCEHDDGKFSLALTHQISFTLGEGEWHQQGDRLQQESTNNIKCIHRVSHGIPSCILYTAIHVHAIYMYVGIQMGGQSEPSTHTAQ